MEYFEVFGLKPGFGFDQSKLKRKYLQLSKETHPDFYAQASDLEQQKALEKSTLVNLAYKTLSNSDKLLEYILRQEGHLLSEQGNHIPQDFLMEMMEINETIMELQFEPDPLQIQEVQDSFLSLKNEHSEYLENLNGQYDKDNSELVLESLKEGYYKMKYVGRIKENVDKLGANFF